MQKKYTLNFKTTFKFCFAKCKMGENAMKQAFSIFIQHKAFAIVFEGNKSLYQNLQEFYDKIYR